MWLSEIAADPGFGGSVMLGAPGDRRSGWLVCSVPKGAEPSTFQFTLGSGFGPQTGEWSR